MLTITTGTVHIDIIDPRVEKQFSVLSPSGWFYAATATMRIRNDADILCQWNEPDVDKVFPDLFDGLTFGAGAQHIDFYYAGTNRHVHVWNETGEPGVAVTTPEDDYIAAVETARDTYLRWRDQQTELDPANRP